MASKVKVLVDDRDPGITFLCPSQKQKVASSYFNNTWTTTQSLSCGSGWFSYVFNGIGVQVSAPTETSNQNSSVRLDGGEFSPQSGTGRYSSSTLNDGEHTIVYAMSDPKLFPAFDYLTYDAGPSTPLKGRTVVVDDDHPDVTFNGKWSASSPNGTDYGAFSQPFENTSHWTNTIGDSLQYRFTGSSFSIYGITTNATGDMTLSISLDGNSSTLTIPSNNTLPLTPMFQIYNHGNIPAGNHTIKLNVTKVTNGKPLGIDFMTYSPSFDNLSSMPYYTGAPLSSLNGTSSTPTSSASSPSSVSVGPIAGGTLGGVAALGLMATAFLARKRRKRRTATTEAPLRSGGGKNSQSSITESIEGSQKISSRFHGEKAV